MSGPEKKLSNMIPEYPSTGAAGLFGATLTGIGIHLLDTSNGADWKIAGATIFWIGAALSINSATRAHLLYLQLKKVRDVLKKEDR